MKTMYMLDRLDSSVMVNWERINLPKGMYVCPAFSNKKIAEEYTQDGKFTISEVKV